MSRLLFAFFLSALSFSAVSFATVENGRYERSDTGESYWLPSWLSKNIYTDFKTQLIDSKTRQRLNQNPQDRLQCQTAYQKLYKKSEIRWSLFFGYADADGSQFTSDIAERDILQKEILSRCPEAHTEIQFCGFQETNHPDEFVRDLRLQNNQIIKVRLRLWNSSVRSEIPRQEPEITEQRRRSKIIEQAYLDALQKDDIVFYAGHARHGSGPGFRPLAKKTRDWWIATLFRPMASKVLHTLNPHIYETNEYPAQVHQAPNPAVIGMFSCEAEAHFGYSFAQNSESSLILTRQSISEEDNMRLIYAASNALLAQECEGDFHSSMREAINTVYYRKNQQPPTNFEKTMPKIFNFFSNDQVKYKNDIVVYFQNKDKKSIEITPEQRDASR